MAREQNTYETDGAPLWNITAGLDRSVVPVRINDLGLDEAWNVYFQDGEIRVRPGLVESRYQGNPASGSYPLKIISARNRQSQVDYPLIILMTPGSGVCYGYVWVGDWELVNLGSSYTSLDSYPQVTFFKDEAIIVPGNGVPVSWIPGDLFTTNLLTAQTDPDLRAPVCCRFVESSGSRVFMANGIDYASYDNETFERKPNRVWWSDTGASNVWSNGTGKPEKGTAGYEDLQQGEFGTYEITGMKMHSAMQLIVFKAWGIWAATWGGDVVTWTFVPGTQKIGTVANGTICQWRDQLIFLGTDRNIYTIDAGRNVSPVGSKIQRYLNRIISNTFVNRSVAAVDPVRNLYILAIPVNGSDFPNRIICFHLETGAISEWGLSYPISCLYAYYPGYNSLPGIFAAEGVAGGQFLEFSYTAGCKDQVLYDENFQNFSAYIWSKVYDYNEMYQQVGETGEIHKIALHGEVGQASARTRVGQGLKDLKTSTPLTFGTLDVGDPGEDHYVSDRTDAKRFAQWGVEWVSGETNPMQLQGVTVYGLPRGEERGGG